MDKDKEYNYLKQFALQADLTEPLNHVRLRSLWTAFCMHHNIDIDTKDYVQFVRNLWNIIVTEPVSLKNWKDCESFKYFLTENLR